jgi:hypothetical protein
MRGLLSLTISPGWPLETYAAYQPRLKAFSLPVYGPKYFLKIWENK